MLYELAFIWLVKHRQTVWLCLCVEVTASGFQDSNRGHAYRLIESIVTFEKLLLKIKYYICEDIYFQRLCLVFHLQAMMIDEGGRQRSFRQSPANVIPPEPPPRRPVMRSINDSPSAQVMSSQLDNQVIKGTIRSTKI